VKSSIVLCYNINKLAYLYTYLLVSCGFRGHHNGNVMCIIVE